MAFINSEKSYGWISIVLHWITGVMIIGLFILGYWMVDLDYYHEWYRKSQWYHESFALLLIGLMSIRLLSKLTQKKVRPIEKGTMATLAHIVHIVLYTLVFFVLFAGYLLSSSGKDSISMFSLLDIPALSNLIQNQADIAGLLHKYAAYVLMTFVLLHILAALKHHFIHKNNILRRMFKP